jgi:hypothetical protein
MPCSELPGGQSNDVFSGRHKLATADRIQSRATCRVSANRFGFSGRILGRNGDPAPGKRMCDRVAIDGAT